jgi:biotin synthase
MRRFLRDDAMALDGLPQTWTREAIAAEFARPLADLILDAQATLRAHWRANAVQTCQLLSIKTGGCPEDCGYCSQSAHFKTGVPARKLMALEPVLEEARTAKAGGATRFCMGAAWRSMKDRDLDKVCDLISGVKALGLETCVTLGMLEDGQAEALKTAGLDYYNHNLDSSPEYYGEVIRTRTYDDRLDTLSKVRAAGLKTCCGGIVGMGESRMDRVGLLHALASLPEPPESVPINALVPVAGTPLADVEPIDAIEFARTIAVARIVFPTSMVRLSAGRETMSRELQALCFLAGANSIFVGGRLLTTPNPEHDEDAALFADLGLTAMTEDEARRDL